MYQTYTALSGQQYIVLVANNMFIPVDNDNMDYKAYLNWVEAGNNATTYTMGT